MRQTFTTVLTVLFLLSTQVTTNAQKRIYLSNDDHTDYMWTQNEAVYKDAFIDMLDWWINYNQVTSTNPPFYQSKWNCDGSFWLSVYEKNKTAAEFDILIEQVRRGQITVPYAPLACTYGGTPAEAVLRGMYYAGSLERRYNLDFNMAIAMENQTIPLGLASLWKGAGAKYCWHGVCNCETRVTGLDNRQNEIYWYKGLDTNRILMKWYSMADLTQNYFIGGYAEAGLTSNAINELSTKIDNVNGKYPYNVAAAFGVGHDALQTTSDNTVAGAMTYSNPPLQQVIVSNEVDFFQDFESNYGAVLPPVTQTLGNEWDLTCASISELSAKIKRSTEKLRAAEAMAAIVTNYAPTFASTLDSLRKEAWNAVGLYWEHSLGFESSAVGLTARYAFQTRLETTFSSYVDQLYNLARSNLSNLITNSVPANARFFAFNPLGWVRTDYADYKYNGSGPIFITDVASGSNTEVPFQLITKNGQQYIRIEAANIPSVGYKVFQINPGTGTSFPVTASNVDLTNNVIESDSFRISFTRSGVLTSITDKKNGNREMVRPGEYVNDLGSGNTPGGSISLESNGPVSATILTTSNLPIPHTTRITLYKKIGRIEIDNQITQNFTDSVKTWAYSFNINDAEVWHEETGAVIRAKLKTNGGHYATQNARYDWSTLNHFASVNDTINNYGISLSNQDCYFMKIGNSSVNSLHEGSAKLNVLAGGTINGLGFLDQGGSNVFNQRFAITAHTSYSAATEMKKAMEHQNFMVCDTVFNPVNFLLPNIYSYIGNSDPGSVMWAVKPAEEGYSRGTVVRLWNLNNTDAVPTITSNLKMSNAYRTTHVETDMNEISGSITNNDHDLPVPLGHNEMKTFRLKNIVVALPVKSLSFTGNKVESSNVLKWDNKGGEDILQKYELQRSADGQRFNTIATVAAKNGNTNNYTFTDENLNIATAYYYRLKMISTNNSFGYSNTILIKAAKESFNIIIFPNPVTDMLQANFILDKQTRCNVIILNTAGSIVKTVAPPLFERGNNFYKISVKELPAGEYIFSVIAGDKKFVKSFIKK